MKNRLISAQKMLLTIKKIKQLYDIDLSRYNELYLQKNFEKRLDNSQYSSIEAYYCFLEQHKEEALLLSNSLHNNYSKFFRNPYTFCSFEHIVLPSFIHNAKSKGRKIRIWSSACASGQEAYTVAILMEEFIKLFKEKTNADFDFYFSDATALKTVVRSNPGLLLLKGGNVLAKWHYNDFPSFEEIKSKFL